MRALLMILLIGSVSGFSLSDEIGDQTGASHLDLLSISGELSYELTLDIQFAGDSTEPKAVDFTFFGETKSISYMCWNGDSSDLYPREPECAIELRKQDVVIREDVAQLIVTADGWTIDHPNFLDFTDGGMNLFRVEVQVSEFLQHPSTGSAFAVWTGNGDSLVRMENIWLREAALPEPAKEGPLVPWASKPVPYVLPVEPTNEYRETPWPTFAPLLLLLWPRR